MSLLTGKNIIIINADHEPVLELVIAAAQAGASVACHYHALQEDAGSRFMQEFEQAVAHTECAKQIVPFGADLSTEPGVQAFFDAVLDCFADYHALIYYQEAPKAAKRKPFADISLAAWNCDLDHYLRQPFLVFRQALEEFVTRGGRLVYVAPVAEANGGDATYMTTQTALHAFQRSITKEYGSRGVACNTVLLHDHPPANDHSVNSDHVNIQTNQRLSAAVQKQILFLASDLASYVNGEVFHVSDGISSTS